MIFSASIQDIKLSLKKNMFLALFFVKILTTFEHLLTKPKLTKNDVIKMREMRGEVGKKTAKKKRWIITHFYDVKCQIFETLCPVTFSVDFFL